MGLLSRDHIRQTDDATYEDVPVPEWGGTVRVKGISGAERAQYEETIVTRKGAEVKKIDMRYAQVELLILACVNDDGSRLFGPDDRGWLLKKSSRPVQRLYDVAARLAGLSESDVEELVEDFGGGPDAPSPTG